MASGSDGRGRTAVLSALVVVVVLTVLGGAVGYGHSRRAVADPGLWVAAGAAGSSSPSAPSPSDPPSPTPSPSPSPTAGPTRKASSPTRKATVKPVPSHTMVAVPPPAAPPPPPSCQTTYSGTAASKADVGAALDAAAAASYHPQIKDVPARTITVSATLLKAVAWQESGWQSNIRSCYGAYGAMQVIASTQSWMNTNYGTSFDMQVLSGNASLGAEYLAWLIYYFGHFCFNDDYDISHLDPAKPDLRDAVLAAYNLGVGAVDTSDGLVIPNRGYTNAVEGLMTSQPWQNP